MRFVISIVFLIFLVGCSQDAEIYISEPAKDKSIMVPAGLSATAKIIKNVFREAGWQTFVSGASEQTNGSFGPFVNINTKAKYPSRYTAKASGRVFDLCFDLSDAVAYDISIIDNVTGEEVAAFAGRGCETQIEKTLKEALKPFL